MRHTSGKASDCFHFLGLTELCLKQTLLGNILNKNFVPERLSFSCPNGSAPASHGYGISAFSSPLGFQTQNSSHGGLIFLQIMQALIRIAIDVDRKVHLL